MISTRMSFLDLISYMLILLCISLSEAIAITSVYGLNITTNKEDLPQAAKEVLKIADSILLPDYDTWKTIPFVHLLLKFGLLQSQENCRILIEGMRQGPFAETLKAAVSFCYHLLDIQFD